jgi:hypothetical protein
LRPLELFDVKGLVFKYVKCSKKGDAVSDGTVVEDINDIERGKDGESCAAVSQMFDLMAVKKN